MKYTSGMRTNNDKQGELARYLSLVYLNSQILRLNISMNQEGFDGITSSSGQMNRGLRSPACSITS